MKTEAIT